MDQDDKQQKVIFEGEEIQRSARPSQAQAPKIAQWIIRYSGGRIKNEGQANYVLLGLVVAAVIFSFVLLSGGNARQKPSAAALEHIKQMPVNR